MEQGQTNNIEQRCRDLRGQVDQLQAENAALRRQVDELRQSLQTSQRERELLGFEIHDGLAQEMTAAVMFLATVEQQVASGGTVSLETLRRGTELVRQSVVEARQLIGGLTPTEPVAGSLSAALDKLIEHFRSQRGLQIDYSATLPTQAMSTGLQWTVQRIIQESLNNVVRHSKSNKAEILIVEREGQIEILVRDFGVGFDPAAVGQNRYGLVGIRERAKHAGGSATIESAPGQGTKITVVLPLTPSE